MRTLSLVALALFTPGAVVAAQETAPAAAQTSASPLERIRAAMRIPTRTAEVREAGVPDSSVRSVLDVFRRRQVEPAQAEEILTTERDAAREHGPTDNFGGFVNTQLESGKKGRELADAIRAEHQARGHGHGKARRGEAGEENERGRAGAREEEERGGRGGRDSAQGRRPERAPEARPSQPERGQPSQGQQGRGRRPN